MKRVLVTGGCGYIGSHTVVDLLAHGYEVVSIDNFARSQASTLERMEKISGKRILNIDLDLADSEAISQVSHQLTHIDGIIHFAAYKSVVESVREPDLYYYNNINSLLNVLKIAKDNGIPSLVFSSSCAVYGNVDQLPVNESTPLAPTASPYAETKVIGERIVRDHCKSNPGLQAILLRYFNPVGAHTSALIGERPLSVPDNLVPYITQTAAGIRDTLTVFGNDYPTRDGSCVRDYIHVMDIARAHTNALEWMAKGGMKERVEVFNLGTGNGVTVLEVIKAFEKATGISLNYRIGPRRPGDVIAVYADNTKAVQELNWKIEYSLEEMMRTAWEWQVALGGTPNA